MKPSKFELHELPTMGTEEHQQQLHKGQKQRGPRGGKKSPRHNQEKAMAASSVEEIEMDPRSRHPVVPLLPLSDVAAGTQEGAENHSFSINI